MRRSTSSSFLKGSYPHDPPEQGSPLSARATVDCLLVRWFSFISFAEALRSGLGSPPLLLWWPAHRPELSGQLELLDAHQGNPLKSL